MTSPHSPGQESWPEHDPFAADRAFDALYQALSNFDPPEDGRTFVKDFVRSGVAVRDINVMSGDGAHALATMLIGAENRRIAIAVKAAPANGKPSLAFVMAPAQVQIRLFTGWHAAEDISAVYMQVSSGPQYGPSEARFMAAVGLSTICPEEIVQESGKGGMGPLYRLEDPTTLEQLAAMPTLAAQLPPATT